MSAQTQSRGVEVSFGALNLVALVSLFPDVAPESLPPSWPISPELLIVENGVYELRSVPITSVVLVTDRSVKVDVAGIVDTHLISRMRDGIAALQGLIEEWLPSNTIPEVDWERLRAFEFQENLRLRDAAAQSLQATTCALCPTFQEHVRNTLWIFCVMLIFFALVCAYAPEEGIANPDLPAETCAFGPEPGIDS